MAEIYIGKEAFKGISKELANITKEDIDQVFKYWQIQFSTWNNNFQWSFKQWEDEEVSKNIIQRKGISPLASFRKGEAGYGHAAEEYINKNFFKEVQQHPKFIKFVEQCDLGYSLIQQLRTDLTGQTIKTVFVFQDSNGNPIILDESDISFDKFAKFGMMNNSSTLSNPFQLAYSIQDLKSQVSQLTESRESFQNKLYQKAQEIGNWILKLKEKRKMKKQELDAWDAEIMLLGAQLDKDENWLKYQYNKLRKNVTTQEGKNSTWVEAGDSGLIQVKFLSFDNKLQDIVYAKFSTIRNTSQEIIQALRTSDLSKLQQIYTEKVDNNTNKVNEALAKDVEKIFKQLEQRFK